MVAGGGAWLVGGHAWLPGGGVAGVCVWLPGGVRGCQGACMVASGGGSVHGWPGGVCRIRRDTVNERAVRILLECILVRFVYHTCYVID